MGTRSGAGAAWGLWSRSFAVVALSLGCAGVSLLLVSGLGRSRRSSLPESSRPAGRPPLLPSTSLVPGLRPRVAPPRPATPGTKAAQPSLGEKPQGRGLQRGGASGSA